MIRNNLLVVGWMTAVAAVLTPPVYGQGSLFDQGKELLGTFGKSSPGASSALSTAEIASGLREALQVGTERVVARVGRPDGFNANPEIHIPLPNTLRKVQSALRMVGASGLADDLELRLNRAAEAASPKAKKIFWQAITDMTLEDIQGIYKGPKDAATQYFRKKMSRPLAESMQPVVDSSLADAGAIQAYDNMMGRYRAMPFVPDVKADLTTYVLEKALDALFLYLAREEAAIRENPLKQSTDLLRRVFGTTS